jgi:hypothetical protein
LLLLGIEQMAAGIRTNASPPGENEVTILARILGNADGEFPTEVARDLVDLEVSDGDKARMHELAARNQSGELTAAEREEMIGYTRATTVLSILKSRARRALGAGLEKGRGS